MAATAAPRGRSPPHLSAPFLKTLGKHRLLRFSNPQVGGDSTDGESRESADTSDRRRPRPLRSPEPVDGESDDDEGLKQLREKLLGHLQEAAEKMKLVGAPSRAEKPPPPPPEPVAESSMAVAARPSKPRSRGTTRKSPVATLPRSLPPPPPPPSPLAVPERTFRLRSEDPERQKEEKRRPPPSVSLSREEIEEDIFGLTGSRPRRRPKKRPRSVQRRLDSLFPGLWLANITAETYKVTD